MKRKNVILLKLMCFFDRSFWIFLLIGAINTVVSVVLQFLLYNLCDWNNIDNTVSYWLSTSVAFAICSVFSFYFNKKYSFKNTDDVFKTALKFALVIAICYFVAYLLAQPIARKLIITLHFDISEEISDKCAMLMGQVIFTILNYIGQRFFAFKKKS